MNSGSSSFATAHALIIGKFYPPHAGHHLLINTAASTAQRVSVIVMAASVESIPLDQRVTWLRAAHAYQPNVAVYGVVDDIRIDYHDDLVWQQHVHLMRVVLAELDAPRVTAVFSSEPYGDELARRFEAESVLLDMTRTLVPISATEVRGHLAQHWSYLEAATRAGLALRVVVIGSESSGTSTLVQALETALRLRGGSYSGTRSVTEYGRDYTLAKLAMETAKAALLHRQVPGMVDLRWSTDEFIHIASRQNEQEDAAAAAGSAILLCDTDALATAVWHERYVGAASSQVLALAKSRTRRLYLVTDITGVPFFQDGLRDGEHVRGWMQQRFLEQLQQSGMDYHLVTGTPEERLQAALLHIDRAAEIHFRFSKPLTEQR